MSILLSAAAAGTLSPPTAVVERCEDDAFANLRQPRLHLDPSARRLDHDQVVFRDSQPLRIARRQFDPGVRRRGPELACVVILDEELARSSASPPVSRSANV
jgi:hypothetical protein